ncbi:hypothetical protein R1flu_003155 [Riccia fluitans]|uniref:Uncharacterized protein n=1 Tax=Riccia fluitans TaxID=41844 RepID=A0ABD1Y877_9MARC
MSVSGSRVFPGGPNTRFRTFVGSGVGMLRLSRESGVESRVHQLSNEGTTAVVESRDNLYNGRNSEGEGFQLSGGSLLSPSLPRDLNEFDQVRFALGQSTTESRQLPRLSGYACAFLIGPSVTSLASLLVSSSPTTRRSFGVLTLDRESRHHREFCKRGGRPSSIGGSAEAQRDRIRTRNCRDVLPPRLGIQGRF